MYKAIHVYDLDGVLVDSSHRYRNLPNGSIDLDYWLNNRHRMDSDKLLPHANKYSKDCADKKIYVIICTARVYTPADVAFIHSRLGFPNKLIMRLPGDWSSDAKLKRRELSRLLNLKQFKHLPRFFWEDSPVTVKALRDLFTRTFLIESKIWSGKNA